ncbi:hypothetical protein CHLRE_17g738250v5 [Chlamydomonas reinhardtii]|uniref:Alkyl transferase n=1 Tax=Chlamydomonas reinhardtii TaxID=3055 RepID=A0A2K3CRJ1_CHLRE|nr:uncharacterized protein CHLRE_17g738250v5 [Chlamydomonas reinhardtii]PNW70903.1 hypothetical protein CHLRE_17g738250v5 [Chlamydomonas reinhardtii]
MRASTQGLASCRRPNVLVCASTLPLHSSRAHHEVPNPIEQLRVRWASNSAASTSRSSGEDPTSARPKAAVPAHVAAVMDGNHRWGTSHGGDWRRGHEEGVNALRRVVQFCREDGVKALTVYAFSCENWGRSASEVGFLMGLLERTLDAVLPDLQKHGVRLTFAGDRAALPESLQRAMQRAEAATGSCTGLVLCVALSYGARQDITRAAQELCRRVAEGSLAPEQVTEQLLAAQLSTHAATAAATSSGGGVTGQVGDPDLLIRTSGEQRLSNFLLWECAYTELYFTDACWPDFDRPHWDAAMQHYATRTRRFGRRGRADGAAAAPATSEPQDGSSRSSSSAAAASASRPRPGKAPL